MGPMVDRLLESYCSARRQKDFENMLCHPDLDKSHCSDKSYGQVMDSQGNPCELIDLGGTPCPELLPV